MIKLVCKEGWTYVSWQRVFVEGDATAAYVYRRLKESEAPATDDNLVFCPSLEGESCLFVLSGESFSIDDFADAVSLTFNQEVVCEDGPSKDS